ncbi:hypothetical protein GCM10025868_24350 [Angustibacter aerolatus]|uniref:Uncharacterized protein n=1 Tax=Angustibacter aerolatus TaxID=1162965 RepID=A0ABQ6JIW0_9ACTN|nr:hypothetical protein GCM10025868_24350 [Angustibacter aerolatus]
MPVSTPKTPTLVIDMVPPAMSAGWVRPSRAVAVRAASASARLAQGHRLRVLDVRHDEAPRGGGGDAEVHRVLDHDLLGLLVPGRVDLGVPAGREEHGLHDDQQRRHLDIPELAVGAQPLDEPSWCG